MISFIALVVSELKLPDRQTDNVYLQKQILQKRIVETEENMC